MENPKGHKPYEFELVYTIPEAAKLLKVDQFTVRNLIRKGYIQALKLGRLKIRKLEIDRFLEWAQGKDFSNLDEIKELTF
ncbi:helix-turn-helix domain-containing protein [Clostridium kluyveri]|uniref:helix-turn-helix domain-containing protein n=1 Tax=Clostridium kluyveri TaxID=1534 RepID=UPI00224582A0|nr:helix-turn-helix domain-containing protein [Clostridium kluyveri]UZQ49805.1 helix-turn-helix domain-containing protein [Clostridium kluyveri]